LVKDAVSEALNDCGLEYKDIQQATVGYLYGPSCCGQRALYEIGMTGIPIFNVCFIQYVIIIIFRSIMLAQVDRVAFSWQNS
jgi:hypothetical protein